MANPKSIKANAASEKPAPKMDATSQAIAATLTLEQVFGIKSQINVQGFTQGHPLAPARNPLFVWDPKDVKDILEWLCEPNPDPVWLTGPTGCGKTEMAVQLAAGLNAPTIVVTGRRDAEPSDILGKVQLVNGSTVFVPGLLITAYERGWFIIFDEIDSNPPEAGVALHRMLEKKPLTLENGDVVYPSSRTLMLATANTRGDGEGGDAYSGTSVFNLATLNRFEKWIKDYPPAAVEEKILRNYLPTVDPKAIEAMVKSAIDIRKAYLQGNCPGPISIRDMIRWGRKLTISANRQDVQSVYHSFDRAFGNGVDRHVRSMLHKLVQSHFNVPPAPIPEV